ncbi:DNA translocase FtsK [Nonomuraea sp. MCN248]|uniref:non-specific serine/threonine protein kinase n=1 Tax=Nonomuraea corallina TaxID=2989783 RepID=A0ABT4SDP2_9ACTN|nr:DNA translocase FtsK [Nonomuraea corallina]MDA0635163.1 DNA translocase FtsK [Nonomuraea corallina]
MREGETLAGRYRLVKKLGAGGMGVVWKAVDLRLDREVAVKVFPYERDPDPRRVERFRAEPVLCGRLQHPGIVVIHDADEDDGRLFFVMELLDGPNLMKVFSRHLNGLPSERVVNIGARLAEALGVAHANKVIHRDIKPANIMLLSGDRPKICDFGIARAVDSGKATLQVGTPAYMAPEQSEGEPDERSDLYSLGCVLYEMATGETPFDGSVWQLMHRHATEKPTPPSAIRGDIPSPLEELILWLLAKKPEDRPQSAEEVAERLRAMRPEGRKSSTKIERLPPDRLLRSGIPERKHTDADDAMAKKIDQILKKALVDAKVAGYIRTPVLTRFEVRLGPTTEATAVLELAGQIVQAAKRDGVRLVLMERSTSPLPGSMAIGVEVPHRVPELLSLGDILRQAPDDSLLAGLGRAGDETSVYLDLNEERHVLIGGNGGRFDPIRSIVASLAVKHKPKRCRLIMVGRWNQFFDLPHVVQEAMGNPLTWAVAELGCRYGDLERSGCRDVEQFNREVRDERAPMPIAALGDTERAHPDVVVVIDELADIDDQDAVVELAREGRAVGIHVVARTARPSEIVLNSRVKGYFPARLALSMATADESIRVINRPGAEVLALGNGLFLRTTSGEPQEIRLAAISDEEIAAIVTYWRG